ncbi:MAG: apolipoprotein N-acyltransferase [Rickettsiales bacterium]|nr:apolipoprotein N-acyltransferase [Rickettsiales bacterium]
MKNLGGLFIANRELIFKFGIVFISGAIGAFAFAPYYIFPLLVISFCSLLYFLFYSNSYKEAFAVGWIFGCGYFLAGLYWISYPLIFYFLDSLWWLIPFAIILIPCILAIYYGLCAIILHKCNNGNKVVFSIYFLCIWVLFEFLRNYLFTGFPWLITGYSLVNWLELVQTASWFGVFGLSVIALSIPVIFFLLIDFLNKKWSKLHMIVCSILAVMFVTNLLYGWCRLRNAPIQLSSHNKVKIIQANINSLLKRDTMDMNAEKIIKLATFNPIEDRGLLYVLLPEGGVRYFNKRKLIKLVRRAIPVGGYLIGGADRVDYHNKLAWNSVFIIDHTSNVVDVYDKTHLVPFGEYIPFRKNLPVTINAIVSTFSNAFIDFSPGAGPRTLLKNTAFPINPLICYESLFSRDVVQRFSRKDKVFPKLLINFTTDMWYKDSSGPYQHFDMTALRAIEFGIPVIRVAGTGISGIIDSYGRVIVQMPLNKKGTVSSYIPLALEDKNFYFAYRDVPILLFLGVIFFMNYTFLTLKLFNKQMR